MEEPHGAHKAQARLKEGLGDVADCLLPLQRQAMAGSQQTQGHV